MILLYPDTDEERGAQISYWYSTRDFSGDILCVYVPVRMTENMKIVMDFVGMVNPDSPAIRIISLGADGKWRKY
jgi:hypothetical protein